MSDDEVLIEREFCPLYEFLTTVLPKTFSRPGNSEPFIAVNPGVDDEPIASFLMCHDQFNLGVPLAIQTFLGTLKSEWIVIGSFDIRNPIAANGTVTRSPSFHVTRDLVFGDTDMDKLKRRWGERLVSAGGGDA